MVSPTLSPSWQFWIDRGGTFTDCLGISPDQQTFIAKILSSDSAPVEAIQAVLDESGEKTRASELVCRVKLGTTVSTNALLERRGVPTALLTNRGLAGVFDIGTQERPELFELEIKLPERLQRWRLVAPGRRDARGEVVEALDLEAARATLAQAREAGALSLAIVWMHAHAFPQDEVELARVALDVGFEYVACSHAQAREIGFLARGETAIVDAYLTPLLQGHVAQLRAALPRAELRFMQSSGGLTDAERFRGPNALLSGPAGGVIAARQVARQAGHDRAIGFDMGGTSTDVSLISGSTLDRAFESEVGRVRVKAPMLRIHTVAAGGGSLCRFDGIRLTVGPESAGSDPGPLCYDIEAIDDIDDSGDGRGADGSHEIDGASVARELTVTDINLALGRVAPDRFPFALRRAPVDRALDQMVAALAATGFERTREGVAAGFFEIANASMAQAIIEVSIERGADPRDHVLVGFGGAGGQHVCAIAKQLGIREILLHPNAGLLSALGIGLARASWDGERDGLGRRLPDGGGLPASIAEDWASLARVGLATLGEEGLARERLRVERSLDLGYAGTDTALPVLLAESEDATDSAVWRRAFEAAHRERFGYLRRDRAIDLKALRVRVYEPEPAPSSGGRESESEPGKPTDVPISLREDAVWFPMLGRVPTPVYQREDLEPGQRLVGPALILEATGTVVLDPGFDLEVDVDGVFRLTVLDEDSARAAVDLSEADPVRLEVLGNRFMSIAEQMGAVLRNTSVSTNIKERLDYSCAVFDGEGGLVANAPHIPVHLGAMADTVDQMRAQFSPFRPGDVLVTNDPFAGGSHLPDVTVVTPVFLSGATEPGFFVASRGHHADIGGKTPGSMPADSTCLLEEGVLIEAFHLVRAGKFDEARIRAILAGGRYPARRPDDNVADLEAMVAANQAGAALLSRLVDETGLEVVHVTMQQLQAAAATKVARELARLPVGDHAFADRLDDGTPICVRLSIEHGGDRANADQPAGGAPDLAARMKIDFAGTGPASSGNLNAPVSVVRAAVIYVLRSLVAERIPLNGGCLIPVEISIPPGSILDPPPGSAVVGGNVETSQRVVDVLLGALGRAAASQGTMNNVTFGDDSFGYYETIGGGAGATPFASGASGVHTHMTNTRITDPEILEVRYPVRLLAFGLRPDTGGAGAQRGGDGVIRRILFLRPVVVSLLTERREIAPFGLEGGAPGAKGRNRVLRQGKREADVLAGRVEVALGVGDELSIETPGGGGFGSPGGSSAKP